MKNNRLVKGVVASALALSMTVSLPNVNALNVNAATNSALNSHGLANNIQDGVMLHAWNWSYNTIKANLAAIKAAGYTTVQTSPVQQPKDYSSSYTDVYNQWWKLYQPVSFSIASSSWLGTRSELASLCSEADKYGIKIICDIVANHLGSGSGNGGLSPQVAQYESDIYNNTWQTLWNSSVSPGDYSVEAVVRASYERPDVNTSNYTVKGRVISLLKECIDCGVDGFRWDMAKHIETPSDGYYASDFWPVVIGQATSYASEKGVDLYNYGEILNTAGNGRSYSYYTPYMSVTDNKTSNDIRKAVNDYRYNDAKTNYYQSQVAANKVVLWNESHDTYTGSDDSSYYTSDRVLKQTWAIVASRQNATALYFVRPGSAKMGEVGTYQWKDAEVVAVNKFHNKFIGSNEYLSASDNVVMNERYNSTETGAVLVNCNGTGRSINMAVNKLVAGEYKDTITGNTFTVENGRITGNMGSTGIAVVVKDIVPDTTSIKSSVEGGNFTTSVTTTITANNATSASYKIGDDDTFHSFTDSATVTFGSDWSVGTSKNLYLKASKDGTEVTEQYTFTKVATPTTKTIYFSNNYGWDTVKAYYWGSTSSTMTWPGVDMTYVKTNEYGEKVYKLEIPADATGFVIHNGNGSQTVDITTITDGTGYYISGTSNGKLTVGTYTYK